MGSFTRSIEFENMNILAIISRDMEKGSTKYRLVQYIDFLRKKGINIKFINRKAINDSIIKKAQQADLVFNQKCLFKTSVARKLIAKSQRTIFDFDDAIYTRPGKPHSWVTSYRVKRRLHLWLKYADVVTTSNHFLAGYARKYSDSVRVIPMALDTDIWKPRNRIPRDEIILGWAGAPVNVPLIEKLGPVLAHMLKKYPLLKLAIFSGQKPKLSCPFEYHPFIPGSEPEFVKNLDIGLLPLDDEEYARGKSPIKALQYLACGVPVVGNIIGATAEILNDKNSIGVSNEKEWLNALGRLVTNRDLAISMGNFGHKFIEKNHNLKTVGEKLFNVLSIK
jgi:glycosyltransferase involved in cell wall biosynthesis